MRNAEVFEPEVISETATEDAVVNRLILWNDDENSVEHVVIVLTTYFKMSFSKALSKINEIHKHGKAPVMEGSIKEIEPYFIILVDNNLQCTIE